MDLSFQQCFVRRWLIAAKVFWTRSLKARGRVTLSLALAQSLAEVRQHLGSLVVLSTVDHATVMGAGAGPDMVTVRCAVDVPLL